MSWKLLILEGDGISYEVIPQVEKIIQFFQENGLKLEISRDCMGGISYDQHNEPITNSCLEKAKNADAVLMCAVGGEKWAKLPLEQSPEGGLLKIRKELNLYANLRPIVVFDELVNSSTLKPEVIKGLDLMIIRELVGGLYFGKPAGIDNLENGEKYGYNTLAYKSSEIERILKVAFDIAAKRSHKVCSIDKANVLASMRLWRDVSEKYGTKNPYIQLSHMYVDAMAMELVRCPKKYDVIVTENMFGDILSDLGSQLTGSIGMLPSASLGDLNGKKTALYEPVHGSAPDIAGKNIANPIATILSFGMMLKYSFGEIKMANKLENAVKSVLKKGYRTADIVDASVDLMPKNDQYGNGASSLNVSDANQGNVVSPTTPISTEEMSERILSELRG